MLIYRSVAVASKSGLIKWQQEFQTLESFPYLKFAGNRSIYTLPKSIQTFYFTLVSNIRTEQTHNPSDMSEMSMIPYSLQKTNKFSEKNAWKTSFSLWNGPFLGDMC